MLLVSPLQRTIDSKIDVKLPHYGNCTIFDIEPHDKREPTAYILIITQQIGTYL